MQELTMGVVEGKFANIIWQNEPISSSDLWKLAEEELDWKKTTTFTVLKRLCDKGIFINNKGTVTSLISKEDFVSSQSEKFIEDNFQGSLPAFIASFTKRKGLTSDQVAELRKLVDEYGEG